MKEYEYSVFIGRFNPFHLGHFEILKQGLELSDKVVVVLGSHNRATNINNPWSSDERKKMITSCFSDEDNKRISFVLLKDYVYNNLLWTIDCQNKIAEATDYSDKIALIGFESDKSSFYLKLFPKWKFHSCRTDYDFHAVDVRNKIFTLDALYKKYIHDNVASFIETWMKEDEFKRLKDEFEYIKDYKEGWRGAPFEPIFCTVDAICVKSGHILLVRRGKKHGKGLLACPGGFLEKNETTLEGAIRELKEETAIKISKEDLEKSVVSSKVFDEPNRSARGRSISHAYLLNLGIGELPKVKGSSDADRAFWLPLNEVIQREAEFFEDHFYIIQYFTNKL